MHVGEAASDGSIPAGAGEPAENASMSAAMRVYPRGCGGAALRPGSATSQMGLSPRVRKSQIRNGLRLTATGSIPAGAGEPAMSNPTACGSRVYPRGCGGAAGARTAMPPAPGLSPRVRGSPTACVWPGGRVGSIPAGAGEPRPSSTLATRTWVYPRGCGGDSALSLQMYGMAGLSPRVRGRPSWAALIGLVMGSIPAGAGETPAKSSPPGCPGVYPRGCGGDRG